MQADEILEALASNRFIALINEHRVWVLTYRDRSGNRLMKSNGTLDTLIQWWIAELDNETVEAKS
jgi:hypothetical protein